MFDMLSNNTSTARPHHPPESRPNRSTSSRHEAPWDTGCPTDERKDVPDKTTGLKGDNETKTRLYWDGWDGRE